MKKIRLVAAAMLALVCTFGAKAQNLEFAYDAGAEIVSTYLWRGQYNGGLSFQPDLAVGWDSEHTSFRFGTWWSLGASDWRFRKNWPSTDDYNPNTYFIPELESGSMHNILFAATGALMSPTSIQQGESIPVIAHLVHFKN